MIAAGRELAGQDRSVSPAIDDYFESQNNTTSPEDNFVKNVYPFDSSINDQLKALTP